MVILKSSDSDRLGAPRAGALAGWSDRRVHGCLNSLGNYLRLVDYTGGLFREGKAAILREVAEILPLQSRADSGIGWRLPAPFAETDVWSLRRQREI